MRKAGDLWREKQTELLAQRGLLTYQVGILQRQLEGVDDQLRALDVTGDLIVGFDKTTEDEEKKAAAAEQKPITPEPTPDVHEP